MPLRCEIKSQNGTVLRVEELWPKQPTEIPYIGDYDYSTQKLERIIGFECLYSDLGGVVHLVDDPEIISAVTHGHDIGDVLGDDTAFVELMPEDKVVELPFTTKNRHIGSVAAGHVLPPPAVLL